MSELIHTKFNCEEKIDTHSGLDLEVADSALLGVRTEDVVVLVDETVELVLQGFDVGALVRDLELQVCAEHGHNFCGWMFDLEKNCS